MAIIKLPTMSYKEIGEKGANYALDEVEYNGLTIRQWADKITGGEYAPVVHGHWIRQDDSFTRFKCSNPKCGIENCSGFENYCPNCGAKMDGEEHNNV